MPRNGGARPGAGRPKGSLSVESKLRLAMQTEFVKYINTHKKKIWEAHLKLALGVHVPVNHPLTGKLIDVYQKPPDGAALAWMQEQIWGKAPQKIEVEADVNATIESQISPEAQAALDQALSYVLPKDTRTPAPRKNQG